MKDIRFVLVKSGYNVIMSPDLPLPNPDIVDAMPEGLWFLVNDNASTERGTEIMDAFSFWNRCTKSRIFFCQFFKLIRKKAMAINQKIKRRLPAAAKFPCACED
jgi:hypothetical protein